MFGENIEMAKIIHFNRDLKITNLGALAHGTGAKYLEVIESHIKGTYIAKQWRRKSSNSPKDAILIQFN
jgi:hypothetical protein